MSNEELVAVGMQVFAGTVFALILAGLVAGIFALFLNRLRDWTGM